MDNSSLSPFIFLDPVIPPIFAGRKRELEYIHRALFQEGESMVLYGNDAIGKSSIISTIYTELNKKNIKKVLPVVIANASVYDPLKPEQIDPSKMGLEEVQREAVFSRQK